MTQAAVHEPAALAAMPAHLSNQYLRQEERVNATLPIILGRGTGVTRNVSASGVFFETNLDYAPESEIRFAIQLDAPGGKMMLKGQGQIVRVERRNGKVGVAAKIIASTLESNC
jgi:hypothetical protein